MKRMSVFHSNAVWPPLGFVAIFALAYAMLDGGLWLIEHGAPNLHGELSDMPELTHIRAGILATAAGCYALFRLWRFHPACNPAYAAWLKSSPWTPRLPLPLGPIHPVWQDAVALGAITAVAAWHAHVDPTLPVVVFASVYLVAMTGLLLFTRTWIPCLLLGFIWPAPILPVMRGWPALGIIAALVAVTWYGHRQSLRAFPWRRKEPDSPRANGGKSVMQMEIRIEGLSNSPSVRTQNLLSVA